MQRVGIKRGIVLGWPFYYGWVIVGLALLSLGVWAGLRTAFAVFYVALLDEFSWSRGATAGVQSMAYVTYILLAPLVGGLIDRFGPRRVILPGILMLSAGLALASFLKSLTQFYLIYGVLVASGITFISIAAYSPILACWFEKKRGIANGCAASGMGLGTFLLVPLSQYLITLWGWRLSFVALGGLVFILLFPISLLLLRHKPEELGLSPDGISQGEFSKREREEVIDPVWVRTDWTLKRVLRSGRYWALMAFSFFVVVGIYLMLIHSVQFFVDQGIDRTSATFFLALVGVISIPARIFWGWLSDSIGREITFTCGAFFVFLAACSLILLERTGRLGLAYAFVLSLGLGWGVTAPMFLSVSADLYQGKRFGSIYGLLEMVIGAGCALGAWIAGFIFDRTQSYQWAFLLAVSGSVLSGFLVWFAAPRKVRRKRRMKEIR